MTTRSYASHSNVASSQAANSARTPRSRSAAATSWSSGAPSGIGAQVASATRMALRLSAYGAAEEQEADGGHDRRDERRADADHADDREYEAHDGYEAGGAAHEWEPVRALLARLSRGVVATAV